MLYSEWSLCDAGFSNALHFLPFARNLLQRKSRLVNSTKSEGLRIHILYSFKWCKVRGNYKSSCNPFSCNNRFIWLLHSYCCNIHATRMPEKLHMYGIIIQPTLTQGQPKWCDPNLDYFHFFQCFIDSQNNTGWKGVLVVQPPQLYAEPTRPACLGPCPVALRVSRWVDVSQSVQCLTTMAEWKSFSGYQIRISLVSTCGYWIPSSHCAPARRIWLHLLCSVGDMLPSRLVSQGPSPKPKRSLEKLWLNSPSAGANLHC